MSAREELRKKIRDDKSLNKSISEQVSSDHHVGEGDLKSLKLNKISLNSKNPRKLNITNSDLLGLIEQTKSQLEIPQLDDPFAHSDYVTQFLTNIRTIPDDTKAEKYEKLLFLAKSIFEHGLLQPIVVFINADNDYTIKAGERRYLAHILMERESIRALVRQGSDDPLRDHSVTLIENIIRDDLSTSEKIDAIEELIQIHEECKHSKVSALVLSELIHESERTCRRYLRFINTSERIREQIRTGELATVRDIEDVIKLESNLNVGNDFQNTIDNSSGETLATKTERAGRKRKVISLGKTESTEVIKILADAIGKVRPLTLEQPVDWNDMDSVQLYWNELINLISLEKEND